MKLVRIVKGVSEIVDYDEVTAKKMIALNPDRYKTIEDFELVKYQYDIEDKKEKRGRKPKFDIEDKNIDTEILS
jgi:hypothetical protein